MQHKKLRITDKGRITAQVALSRNTLPNDLHMLVVLLNEEHGVDESFFDHYGYFNPSTKECINILLESGNIENVS